MVEEPADAAQAPCRQPGVDPEMFFSEPVPDEGQSSEYLVQAANRVLEAKVRYCDECPVTEWCLERGLDEEWGLWGGFDAAERQRIRAGLPVRTGKPPAVSARREQVVRMVKRGMSIDEVGVRLGTKKEAIRGHLHGHLALRHKERLSSNAA